MPTDLIDMFEQLAAYGQAPSEGCSLFGTGYESAFEQLRQKYIVERFSRGGSAEKFVIGPYGSGKTHFLRQLMEIGRLNGCVTAEVPLNRNVEFTEGIIVYKELARELRAPVSRDHGLRALVLAAVERVERKAREGHLPPEPILEAWARGLTEADFALPSFGRVARQAVEAHIAGATDQFEECLRWLGGEVTDKTLGRLVSEPCPSKAELKVVAHRARLSLFQFVRHAGFRGTIIGFDEAEQSMAVDRKKMSQVFSHLLSEINAVVDLQQGAALIIYALTPDVIGKIEVEMPMLMQRLMDPGPRMGFFDGNALAPRIDLTERHDAVRELTSIAERLGVLFFGQVEGADRTRQDEALDLLRETAIEVASEEASSSARRVLVKRVCTQLLMKYHGSATTSFGTPTSMIPEAEV